jgi:hypothetical protein
VSYQPRRLRNVWPTNPNRTLDCKPRSSRQGLLLFSS